MNQNDVHRRWENRSRAYSPGYYAYYGPNEASERLREALDDAVGPDAAVLEPGCSSGRHLAHLHDHGYDDLAGVEINGDALDVMAESYPDLADAGTFHVGPIERVVPEFDDDAFDAVFSVETLQHVHPDSEWVFAELARVASDLIVTVENEGERADGDDEDGNTGEGEPRTDAGASGDAGDGEPETAPVSYVDGEIPLYYRRWDRVFTDLGFVEVESRSLGRDTFRAFRRTRR
ncbi:class I SAM-dependent methyltransferase [Salinilacihabitans rarus]|uniref:class I SAM-dependent methyltransferase n=1 Tax=Salinilacihabitans rarus TaxID=2961596 RepID=UPI0020C8FE98|nr:class I SAM-dependent methyltransferase [Salinilacihabitans rarus]